MLPAHMSGICVGKCTADADCKAGQKCDLSAGMGSVKTCR
jgi:Cys-rich repeat protein